MKNQLLSLEEEKLKLFAITDSEILVSSKRHSTLESLLQSREKPGLLENFGIIPLYQIVSLQYNSKEKSLRISYQNDVGKTKKEVFVFDDEQTRAQVAEYLSTTLQLKPDVREESKTSPALMNGFLVLITVALTFFLRSIAIDMQNGIDHHATGRRSGAANLLYSLVNSLGPLWTTVAGLATAAGIAYLGYRRFKKPAQVHVFEK